MMDLILAIVLNSNYHPFSLKVKMMYLIRAVVLNSNYHPFSLKVCSRYNVY